MSSYFGFEHIGSVAVFVLIILGIMSVASWTLIIYKWILFRSISKKNSKFLNYFIQNPDQSSGLTRVAQSNESLASNIYILDQRSYASAATFLDTITKNMESGFSWISSIGATSPFIGLFGTVWGIINAFSNIGAAESVSIATVAPGISEALITTAAGIFVAVPAVIGYNLLHTNFSSIIREMESFLETIEREKNK